MWWIFSRDGNAWRGLGLGVMFTHRPNTEPSDAEEKKKEKKTTTVRYKGSQGNKKKTGAFVTQIGASVVAVLSPGRTCM